MLSLPKILLLLVIVGAVIYGTRVLGRARKAMRDNAKDGAKDGVSGTRADRAVDMAKCAVCGNYVDPSAGPCDRADCPQG